MNAMRSMKWVFAGTAACTALAAISGCELLVQFDRNLIDAGATDGTMDDAMQQADATSTLDAGDAAPAVDAAPETSSGDTGTMDAPDGTLPDSGVDASTDGGGGDVLAVLDALPDVPVPPFGDALADSPSDAGEIDTGLDVGIDVGDDGSADATSDGTGDDGG